MKKIISSIICALMLISFAVAITAADETVWIATSGKGKKYHYEDCRTLRGGKREISLSEAKKMGYTGCGVCDR